MILIVDDSEDMQELLELALTDDGFQVKTASNGKEALNLIECDNLPNLIFLDSKMDVMDGQAFLNALEERCHNTHTQKINVVVMSGSDEPLQSSLITTTLRKPVDLDQFRQLAMKYAKKSTTSQHP